MKIENSDKTVIAYTLTDFFLHHIKDIELDFRFFSDTNKGYNGLFDRIRKQKA